MIRYDPKRTGQDKIISHDDAADWNYQGVLGGLVSQPSFLDAIGNPNASFLGTIVALYNVGCLVGCMAAAIWGNRFGRRNTILIGNAIMIVGAIIQAATFGAGQLIAGRLISGIGNGEWP